MTDPPPPGGGDKPGGVDNPEHPDSGSATLPLRGASQREAGFPRAQAGDGSRAGPGGWVGDRHHG